MTRLCECGCGERVGVYAKNNTAGKRVKGQPMRFIRGHSGRSSPLEYLEDENGCWIWQRSFYTTGYGAACPPGLGKKAPAHRYYYEKHVGPIPDGLVIDHLCRTPACVNPAHLEPVTVAENARRGNKALLTWDDVQAIRASSDSGAELAARYGVARSTVYDLRKKNSRRWVGA